MVVRSFTVGDDVTRLAHVLEVPRIPVRGDRLTVPGGSTPLVVEYVILHASAGPWAPGWAAPRAEVELAAEPRDGLDAATERGWQPVVTHCTASRFMGIAEAATVQRHEDHAQSGRRSALGSTLEPR